MRNIFIVSLTLISLNSFGYEYKLNCRSEDPFTQIVPADPEATITKWFGMKVNVTTEKTNPYTVSDMVLYFIDRFNPPHFEMTLQPEVSGPSYKLYLSPNGMYSTNYTASMQINGEWADYTLQCPDFYYGGR